MKQIVRKILIPASAFVIFGGCASLSAVQSFEKNSAYGPDTAQNASKNIRGSFEQDGLVDAADFLPAKLMHSAYHTVEAQAHNDGFSNIYRIQTRDHIYVVQGTQNTKTRIHEIKATNILRERSTFGTAAKAATGRVTNLVETPVRAVKGGAKRFADAQTTGDKFMVIPSGIGDIIGNLATGLKELGTTGVRITAGAAGTKCKGLGCAAKAGEDIWSGFNSLAGKHASAREIHKSVGTDPYSANKVLQREVDRLSYADAYTSTSVKFGLTWSGVRILDPAATYIGYYNNAEFLAIYEDAHKRRNKEKKLLTNWGVSAQTITALYSNDAFSHTSRTRLVQTMSKLGNKDYRARLVTEASTSKTRFIADSRLSVYQYLAKLDQSGMVKGFVANAPSSIAISNDDVLILPFAADYLKWTNDIASAVINFAALPKRGASKAGAEIHILGKASPLFKRKAKNLGVTVREIL